MNAGSGREENRSAYGNTDAEEAGTASVTRQSFYFDTICQITVYDMVEMSEDHAQSAIQGAFSLCAGYEKLLSKTVEGSDIWKINHAKGEPVSCSEKTIDVIRKGIYYGDLTDGAFDITIGRCEDLWDFHSDNPKLPDPAELVEALEHVDYKNIIIGDGTVQMKDPEAEIDLGGIAKGYIADRTAEYLEENGVTSAIISLGGNIECIGGKPDEERQVPFTIGIETPYSDMQKISGTVQAEDETVVTSGVYERYFELNGKEYHHILDVHTGYPVDTDVLGVTITGKKGTSADCDALSTSCLILGSEKGLSLIEGIEGYEAAFILKDESITETKGMDIVSSLE